MPKETFWGNVSFTAKSHGYLLAGVKSDLLDVFKNPDKYRKLYIDRKTGKKIDFKDIPCQEYRLFFKNDALQPFTANTFGPFFRSIRDKIANGTISDDEDDVSFDSMLEGTVHRSDDHHQKRSAKKTFDNDHVSHGFDGDEEQEEDNFGLSWERHLKDGLPLQGSNEGKLCLPYKWFLQDHVEEGGKVKKVHLEIQLLSGTSSGTYTVSIGGAKRNKLIVVDQEGPSKDIFFRAERIKRDDFFRVEAPDIIQGYERLYSTLTCNDTLSLKQVMEITFDFPLRKIETPHCPYDEEFFPDAQSATLHETSIVTGVNLTIIVDWNDVSRPQTGYMKRNRAGVFSPSPGHGTVPKTFNSNHMPSSSSNQQATYDSTPFASKSTPKVSGGTNHDPSRNSSTGRERQSTTVRSVELGDDDSSFEDEEEDEVANEDYSYSEDSSSMADDCSTIATRSYHFGNFVRSATDEMTNQQKGKKMASSRSAAPAFHETKSEEMKFLSDPAGGKMERSFSELDLNRDQSGYHSSVSAAVAVGTSKVFSYSSSGKNKAGGNFSENNGGGRSTRRRGHSGEKSSKASSKMSLDKTKHSKKSNAKSVTKSMSVLDSVVPPSGVSIPSIMINDGIQSETHATEAQPGGDRSNAGRSRGTSTLIRGIDKLVDDAASEMRGELVMLQQIIHCDEEKDEQHSSKLMHQVVDPERMGGSGGNGNNEEQTDDLTFQTSHSGRTCSISSQKQSTIASKTRNGSKYNKKHDQRKHSSRA